MIAYSAFQLLATLNRPQLPGQAVAAARFDLLDKQTLQGWSPMKAKQTIRTAECALIMWS
jgi:hypothetical protein